MSLGASSCKASGRADAMSEDRDVACARSHDGASEVRMAIFPEPFANKSLPGSGAGESMMWLASFGRSRSGRNDARASINAKGSGDMSTKKVLSAAVLGDRA